MAMKVSGAGGKRGIQQNADMNVTPFVDVMLVLLIIFMVAAPLATTAVKVDARPNKPASGVTCDPTYVSIAQDGYYVSGRRSSIPTLAGDVARSLGSARPTEETIVIHGDRGVDYGRLMRVVNTLKAHGYNKFGLLAESAPGVV
jgi:biopolymer transport protein ExbD